MALWKITVKSNHNWGAGKALTKGMFIEMSTQYNTPPVTSTNEKENVIRGFNNKYGTRFDPTKSSDKGLINTGNFTCEKIG